jgi:1-acyl-sn-glycerol-3-phosphate acyltransferase
LHWITLALRFAVVALLTIFWGVLVILFSYFDPYAERAARLVRFWARGVLWICGVKVRLRGREHLDPTKAYLFMANHQSNFDIPILMVAFDTLQVRWVSKKEVRKVPIIGFCMERTHQVLVDRERTRDGHLQPFKPGGFVVAIEAGVPVVPVAIKGSRALWIPGGVNLRPGTVEVVFCEPVFVNPLLTKKAARDELLVRVQNAIAAHVLLDSSQETTTNAPVLAPTAAAE